MKPTFVISFDTELIWGSFTHTSPARFDRKYPRVRETIQLILELLERYEISATWAVVGHLFMAGCVRDADGKAHPEMKHPAISSYPMDWYAADPCSTRSSDPLWYGDDIVDLIKSARTEQEIGCHSFSHPPFGDIGCTREVAASEIDACVRLAKARGIDLRSFVFPRNSEGHHDVLRERGMVAYRGLDPMWFRALPGSFRAAAHLLDHALALPPPVSCPTETHPGLWNIPGSMLFLHRAGIRRVVPLRFRVRKARIGLRRAIREEKVFHLWTHPFNLTADRRGMLAALESILQDACQLREAGQLTIEPMGALAARLAAGAVDGEAPYTGDLQASAHRQGSPDGATPLTRDAVPGGSPGGARHDR